MKVVSDENDESKEEVCPENNNIPYDDSSDYEDGSVIFIQCLAPPLSPGPLPREFWEGIQYDNFEE